MDSLTRERYGPRVPWWEQIARPPVAPSRRARVAYQPSAEELQDVRRRVLCGDGMGEEAE